MTRSGRISLVFALLAVGAGGALAQEQKKADGKDLFLAAKCNTCHSVTAAGIEKKKPTEAEAAEAAEAAKTADKDAKKPPDLSSVGLDKKADWIAKFLTKKETLDGEKHKKLYKGTEEELTTLSTWLEAQKAPKKKGGK